ncbi:hypothetical protein QAD02_000904 [Eretmocerus hayati]|uniref:Uncharacterized protein n=1 Tax=Eretmocerus hayati TaxID=131215 RepID=A0ACC2NJC1_9HYME|nr:hypothetical protein QAD02_000904 [Eretmocerus hayati]
MHLHHFFHKLGQLSTINFFKVEITQTVDDDTETEPIIKFYQRKGLYLINIHADLTPTKGKMKDRWTYIRNRVASANLKISTEAADEENHNEILLEDEVRNDLDDLERVDINGQAPAPALVEDFVQMRLRTPVVIEFIDLTGDGTIPHDSESNVIDLTV